MTWIATGYVLWPRFETTLGFIGIVALLYLSTFFMYLAGMANGIKMSRIVDEGGFIRMSEQMKNHYENNIKDNPNYFSDKIKQELKDIEDKMKKDTLKKFKPDAKA